MIIFEEEYRLVLAFYIFDQEKSDDINHIIKFTDKLYGVTSIKRSPEIIRVMLSNYKKVDPQYNTLETDESYRPYNKWLSYYSYEIHKKN